MPARHRGPFAPNVFKNPKLNFAQQPLVIGARVVPRSGFTLQQQQQQEPWKQGPQQQQQ